MPPLPRPTAVFANDRLVAVGVAYQLDRLIEQAMLELFDVGHHGSRPGKLANQPLPPLALHSRNRCVVSGSMLAG
jgi:hypothetical protein